MQLADRVKEAAIPSAADSSASANELTFEIRYRANSRVLDHRGEWAAVLATEMALPHWQIVENRIDIFNAEKTRQGFVAFKNAGYLCGDVPTATYFPEQVGKFIRKLYSFAAFGSRVHIDRIGLRSRFATPFPDSFEALASRFATRYVAITQTAKDAIGADSTLLDIGAPLNFKDRIGFFNTVSGPMKREEFARWFTKNEPFPAVGLFYDIDYFKLPASEMAAGEVATTVSAFASAAWSRHERVRDLILL